MSKKLSLLWVRGPSGHVMHRKREYNKTEGLTLCGIHVGKGWWIVADKARIAKARKCKRCAA